MSKTSNQAAPRMTRAELALQPKAPEGMQYIAIGPCAWGRSTNADQAFKLARREGGAGKYLLHLVNEDAEIDPISGTVYYRSTTPGLRINMAVVVAGG